MNRRGLIPYPYWLSACNSVAIKEQREQRQTGCIAVAVRVTAFVVVVVVVVVE